MQVVVKTPHIWLEGEVTDDPIDCLRRRFGEIEVIDNDDEELVEVLESEWYRSIKPTISPGENMRVYRELHRMAYAELVPSWAHSLARMSPTWRMDTDASARQRQSDSQNSSMFPWRSLS